jgi:hypothetical protein
MRNPQASLASQAVRQTVHQLLRRPASLGPARRTSSSQPLSTGGRARGEGHLPVSGWPPRGIGASPTSSSPKAPTMLRVALTLGPRTRPQTRAHLPDQGGTASAERHISQGTSDTTSAHKNETKSRFAFDRIEARKLGRARLLLATTLTGSQREARVRPRSRRRSHRARRHSAVVPSREAGRDRSRSLSYPCLPSQYGTNLGAVHRVPAQQACTERHL